MDAFARLPWMGGRLARGGFWRRGLLLIVAAIVLSIILAFAGLAETRHFTTTVTPDGGQPTTSNGWTSTLTPLGSLIVWVVTIYPFLSICIRRRHDRGGNGWDVLVVALLGIVSTLLGIAGQEQSIIAAVVGFAGGLGVLYLLVVLGFLRGTPGPNLYGDDPLRG